MVEYCFVSVFYLASGPAGQVSASFPIKLLFPKQAAEQSGRVGKQIKLIAVC